MADIKLNELNRIIEDGKESAIALAEEKYHCRIGEIADYVAAHEKIKIIMLAGPSGSGKTTSANLIADALRNRGEECMVVSLDDFYRDSTDPRYPRRADGERDFECPEALHLDELSNTLKLISGGKAFCLPRYDFKTAKRAGITEFSPVGHGCVIIEGLHALNPAVTDGIPKDRVLKLFVSVSTNLCEGEERIISGRKIRFVRRLVRDSIYRGSAAERTLEMWHHVLSAEDIYLYPYKSLADVSFDTFHSFELGVMRPFALKLLTEELAKSDGYVRIVREALLKILPIEEELVPLDSLIREFIPGGKYESLY